MEVQRQALRRLYRQARPIIEREAGVGTLDEAAFIAMCESAARATGFVRVRRLSDELAELRRRVERLEDTLNQGFDNDG